jgi:hypothetical protein
MNSLSLATLLIELLRARLDEIDGLGNDSNEEDEDEDDEPFMFAFGKITLSCMELARHVLAFEPV